MSISTSSLRTAVVLAGFASSLAYGAGFQLNEHSVGGLGRAYAGEAANVESTAVIFRNPAAMSYFDSISFAVGGTYVDPRVDISGSSAAFGPSTANDVAQSGIVPNASIVVPLNDRWWLGLSASSNFNTGVEFGSDFSATHFGQLAEITTADINFSAAYKVNQQLSVGAGASLIIGEGRIRSTLPANFPGAGGATMLDMEGDNHAWTWNVGAMWQINPQHRVALTYKHHVTLDLEGSANSDIGGPVGNGNLPIDLPAMAELASEHQLSDALRLHFSFNWTGWSRFESLTANVEGVTVPVKQENWDDTYRLAIGSSYQLNPQWLLRAGFAYDKGAVDDEFRTITIPDSDRLWYSAGVGYQLSPNASIDVGLTYIHFRSANITETTDLNGITDVFSGRASGNVWLAGLQYNHRF
ncbi:OmpP1/FadL family transporter [Aliagarivorans marinus]|uniref:OmpP1/FadL family transporter n=1 Tax=Aliagarivorans marinus TaxID=561965 RepID=UPI00041C871E|nr:outer membrane protein transport protein [Aliagarivorans marinus]